MDDQTFIEWLPTFVVSTTVFAGAAVTTLHAVFRKENVRSAIGWIGLVWLSPVIGIVLYLMLGINRIRRQAKTLRAELPAYNHAELPAYNHADRSAIVPPERVDDHIQGDCDHLVSLATIGEENVMRPLLGGNRVTPLFDGDQAYPAMLEAIDDAETSIALVSYIFDNDTIGREFADALQRAHERGVEVRVLVDAAGARYTFPSIIGELKKREVPVARFLPSSLIPPYILSVNLRNHRKLMVVDGKTSFAGGINIRDACVLENEPDFPTRDLHFRIDGPISTQLMEIVAEDWTFTTGERLEGETWFPVVQPEGDVIARGISDGPDEDLDKLRWTLLGAINESRSSIKIVTPYFLPDDPLTEALIVASMRGVEIDIILPHKNNLPYVAWACMGQLRPLLTHNINVWFTHGPFDHSKLAIVDRVWTILGSPNWDPRSLRLNFEFAMECYDRALAERMADWVAERVAGAELWTLADHDARSWPRKLRDGIFRLGSPYL